MSAKMGTRHSKSQSMSNSSLLPEEVLLQILILVPGTDLIRHCTLVCTLWRDIINSPTLWKIKCQNMGYITKDCLRTPKDWKQFYYLSSKKRNLLRNPCAMEGFKFWNIEQNQGDRWAIEDLPGSQGQDFPDKEVTKYFVTSYGPCKKSQLINLKKIGYGEKILDLLQPDIVIRDWFAARHDCGCQYEVLIQLLSEKKKPMKVFNPDPVMTKQWSDAQWHQAKFFYGRWTFPVFTLSWCTIHVRAPSGVAELMTHTFSNYGPGARYIYFQHGGQDTHFWAGWYGVRVTSSSITIEPEDLRA